MASALASRHAKSGIVVLTAAVGFVASVMPRSLIASGGTAHASPTVAAGSVAWMAAAVTVANAWMGSYATSALVKFRRRVARRFAAPGSAESATAATAAPVRLVPSVMAVSVVQLPFQTKSQMSRLSATTGRLVALPEVRMPGVSPGCYSF